jgi:hypothetical protein
MKTIDTTDFITPFKLLEHVNRSLPWDVAVYEIRKKWFDGEIRFWVRWLPEQYKPGVVQSHCDEAAPPEFLLNMENRGIPFERVASDEDGIYFGDGRTAYLFASRADAARFWPWDEQVASKRITGRKVVRGAPPAYDWEKALIEAARYIFENGLPKSQAKLVRHMLKWFGEPEPSETQVKQHIGPLYNVLRDVPAKASKMRSGK